MKSIFLSETCNTLAKHFLDILSKNTITLSPSYFFLLFEIATLMKWAKEISFKRGNGYEKILYFPAGTNRKKTAKFIIQNRSHRPFALHSLLHLVVCANGAPHFGRSQRHPLGGSVRACKNVSVRWTFYHRR